MKRTSLTILSAILLSLVVVVVEGCGDSSTGPAEDETESCIADPNYDPLIDPAEFVTGIDNPLLPLVPGTSFVYEGGGETIEITVTANTKQILGVTAIEVHDVVMIGGTIVEDTLDWYAQDRDGNVWYFGEDTKEYENGVVVSTEGSWEAGVDGAKAGIVMHEVQPPRGVPYRQEYYVCEAEDEAAIVALDQSVTVPFGVFANCLQTREFTLLDPDVNEYKYYAPGIGLVLEVDIRTGTRVELSSVVEP